ncbi:MAG TPA: hypothetical protein VGK67_28505 [Myxococcales bacterium]
MTRMTSLAIAIAVALVSLPGCDGGKPSTDPTDASLPGFDGGKPGTDPTDASLPSPDGGKPDTDPSSLPSGGTYFDKCKVVCEQKATQTGSCAGYTVDACARQCAALAEGLPIGCAQCRITGGYVYDRGTQCAGFQLSSSCPECSGLDAPAPAGDVFLNKCKVVCAQADDFAGSCQGYAPETCVEQCAALAEGLPLACGQCGILGGYIYDNGSRCVGFQLGSACVGDCASPKPDAPASSVYEDKCRVACAQETLSGSCAGFAQETCVQQCTALASGLPLLCGQCAILGGYVWDDGSRCVGFQLGSACVGDCASPKPDAPAANVYEDKCRVACAQETLSGSCASFAQATCTQQCTALASGLPLLCGQCAILGGYVWDDGSRCVGFQLGSACVADCETPAPAAPPDSVYLDKCRVICAQEDLASGHCSSLGVEGCAQQCTVLASGLPLLCGQCRIEGGYVWDDGTTCKGFQLSSSCGSACQ